MTNLAETRTEAIAYEATCVGMDDNDRMIYDRIHQDLHQRFTLSILLRGGVHHFFIAPEADCYLPDFAMFKRQHKSRVKLDVNESFVTLEKLKTIIGIVCRDLGLTLIEVTAMRKANVKYFEYSVKY